MVIPALSMPMAHSRKFCGILDVSKIKKNKKNNFFSYIFFLLTKKSDNQTERFKKIYTNSTGQCMDV